MNDQRDGGAIAIQFLDEDLGNVMAEPLDRRTAEWLESVSRGEKPVKARVTPAPDADVSGHAADAAVVIVTIDDDTEGHAISLRFPSAQEAKEFQQRLIVAGALTATLAIGAAGVGVMSGPSIGTGTAAPDAGIAAQALQDQRLGEQTAGSDAAAALRVQRAGEIGAGSIADPAAGLADHRAGEIGAGSIADPAAGLADHRAGEIGLGSQISGQHVAPGATGGLAQASDRSGQHVAPGATGGLADQATDRSGQHVAPGATGGLADEGEEAAPTKHEGQFRGR